MLLDEVKAKFSKQGFQLIDKQNSGDYTLYFWRDINILIGIEEAHRHSLSGKVNAIRVSAWFNPDNLDSDRLRLFHNYSMQFNLIGFDTGRNLEDLIEAIAALQQFQPEKGTVRYWDEGSSTRLNYLIS